VAGLGSGWPVAVVLMVLGRPRRHFEGAGDAARRLSRWPGGARRSEAVPPWEGWAELGGFWSGRVTRQPGCRAGCRAAGGAGAAPVGVGAARSAVIMAGRVITEDRAAGHAPEVPGSRNSSWSWNIARVGVASVVLACGQDADPHDRKGGPSQCLAMSVAAPKAF